MSTLYESLSHHPVLGGGIVLGVLGYVVAVFRSLPGQLFSYAKSRLITSVEIPDQDPAFGWLERWMAARPHCHSKRASILTTVSKFKVDGLQPSATTGGPCSAVSAVSSHFVFTPAPGAGMVRFRNHRLWVERRRRWYDQAFNGAPHSDQFILTHLGGLETIRQLMEEARDESVTNEDPGVSILLGNPGGWGHHGYRPRRPIDSVMLPAGVIDELLADMRQFYSDQKWYHDRGIPWHRGYLFAGVPGSGKTSLAMALAGEFDLKLAVASLSAEGMDDQGLGRLMIALPERSVFLLEDVDVLFQERESKCDVTFGGLLNALDGVAASEGRTLIMTTNHPDRLDAALIRCGRVDRRVDFGCATKDQVERLFRWFFRDSELTGFELTNGARRFGAMVASLQVPMSSVQEHLIRHRNSPEEAYRKRIPTNQSA